MLGANTLENAISYSSSFIILLDMSCCFNFCIVDICNKVIIHKSEWKEKIWEERERDEEAQSCNKEIIQKSE